MKIQLFNPSEIAAAAEEMEFCDLGSFDAGGAGAFWSNPGGPSPWEMHPDCDELLHVIDGQVDLEILPPTGGEAVLTELKAGWFLIVPRGCWHRQNIRSKSTEFYVTPGQTLHSNVADPRLGSK